MKIVRGLLLSGLVFLAFAFFSYGVMAEDWEYLDSGVTNDLNGISCPDDEICYAVGGAPFIGGAGIVLKSDDGGESWVTQTIPTSEPVRAIKCVDEEVCYAAGDNIILKTDDGETWRIVNSSASTFWDIDAVDDDYAIAVGNLGARLRTTNEGESWSGFVPGVWGSDEPSLSSIFLMGSNGWIGGAGGIIRISDDSGASWRDIASGQSSGISDIFSLDGNTLWACGSFDFIIKSGDGGERWDEFRIPSMGGCGAIEFANSSFGWVLGNGAISHSVDGGLTWEVESGLERVVFFRDIECFGPGMCYAVGDDGVIIRYGSADEVDDEPEETDDGDDDDEERGNLSARPRDPGRVSIACPAEMDDCEAGWNPVFSYDRFGCARNYTCVRGESKELSDVNNQFGQGLGDVPGLGENEWINIYISNKDGTTSVFGVIIEDKKFVKIVKGEIDDNTYRVYLSEETAEDIVNSKNRVAAALSAVKRGDIKIKGETAGRSVKVMFLRIAAFFKSGK